MSGAVDWLARATPSDSANLTPLVELRHVDKSFPGVRALRDVSFALLPGEVHALVGENGAGKSTLMKILGGVYQPDAGEIRKRGEPLTIPGPSDAQHHGIALIHQELNLVPHLTVAQNIFLGREASGRVLIDDGALSRRAMDLLDRLHVAIDPRAQVARLSVAAQQMVEIAKALSFDSDVIVMDEPTAALTQSEVDTLFRLIRDFVCPTTGVIYISHRMEEIRQIADRITVMRDGAYIDTRATSDIEIREVISLMVGRDLAASHRRPPRRVDTAAPEPPLLEVRSLSVGSQVRDVSFSVRRGEILAFAGLVGAGRTEVARAVSGVDRRSHGTVLVNGHPVSVRTPADAVRHGIGYLSEDRKRYGLLLRQSVQQNVGLPSLGRFVSRAGLVKDKALKHAVREYIASLKVKTPSAAQRVANLSGGNQQKVVLAKWLLRDCDILFFDEPTRGIDVGAKQEIYELLERLADEGKAIVVISSELEEVLRIADRIAVMCNGRITGLLSGAEASQESIMDKATRFSVVTDERGALA